MIKQVRAGSLKNARVICIRGKLIVTQLPHRSVERGGITFTPMPISEITPGLGPLVSSIDKRVPFSQSGILLYLPRHS